MLNNLERSSLVLFEGSRDLVCCKGTDGQNVSPLFALLWAALKECPVRWTGLSSSIAAESWGILWVWENKGERPWGSLKPPLSPLLSPPQSPVVHPDLKMTHSGVIKLDFSRTKGSNTTWSCCTEYFILFFQRVFNENSGGQKGILSLSYCWWKSVLMLFDTSAAAVGPGQKSRSLGRRFRLIQKMPLFFRIVTLQMATFLNKAV